MPLKADQPKRESKSHALGWSCAISIALLVVFGFLQTYKSPVMELKAQWLWIAVLPILIVLVIGKYIGKFEAPGIKFEQFKTEPEMRLLLYAPPPMRSASSDTQDNRPDREALEHWTDEGGVEFAEQPDALERWTTHRDSEYKRTDRLFLVHVYEPSTRPKQKYDITIFSFVTCQVQHRTRGRASQRLKSLNSILDHRGTTRFLLLPIMAVSSEYERRPGAVSWLPAVSTSKMAGLR